MATYDYSTLPLFAGLSGDDIERLLACTGSRVAHYQKGEVLLPEGAPVSALGMVLEGTAHSVKSDEEGKKIIVSLQQPGSYIAILLAASHGQRSPVSIEAQTNMAVLYLPLGRIIRNCGEPCIRHETLLRNLFDGIAQMALAMHSRTECLTRFSVRERVLTYLRQEAAVQKTKTLSLPLDRSGMAEYLAVDRSALSRELGRMKRDGLIDFYKNSFRLLQAH